MKLTQALESLDVAAQLPPAPLQTTTTHVQQLYDVLGNQQAERARVTAAAVEDLTDSLAATGADYERVKETIAEANSPTISLEAMVFATHALSASELGRLFNDGAAPAMESVVDGQVTISTEGIKEVLASIGGGLSRLHMRYADEVIRSFSFGSTRTRMLRHRVEGAIKQVSSMADGKTDEVRVNLHRLTIGGKVLSAEAYTAATLRAFELLSFMVTKFQREQYKAIQSNCRMADALNPDTEESYRKTFGALTKSFKDARDGLTPAQKSMVMPGEFTLFRDAPAGYTGTDAGLKRLDEVVTKSQISSFLSSYTDHAEVRDLDGMAPGLSKAQVKQLLAGAQKLLSQIDVGAMFIQSLNAGMRTGTSIAWSALFSTPALYTALLTNGVTFIIRALPVALFRGGRKHPAETNAIKRALQYQSRSLHHTYFDSCQLALIVAKNAIKYCEASMQGNRKELN